MVGDLETPGGTAPVNAQGASNGDALIFITKAVAVVLLGSVVTLGSVVIFARWSAYHDAATRAVEAEATLEHIRKDLRGYLDGCVDAGRADALCTLLQRRLERWAGKP